MKLNISLSAAASAFLVSIPAIALPTLELPEGMVRPPISTAKPAVSSGVGVVRPHGQGGSVHPLLGVKPTHGGTSEIAPKLTKEEERQAMAQYYLGRARRLFLN